MKPVYFTTVLAVTTALSAGAWAAPIAPPLDPTSRNAHTFGGATNLINNPNLQTPSIASDNSSGSPVNMSFSSES